MKTVEPANRAEALLVEFVRDVRAAGPASVRKEWPDLYITFREAERLLNPQGKT